jgi:hypothetical protein
MRILSLWDKIAATVSLADLKPEYRQLPIENIEWDMLAAIVPQPGIIFYLPDNGRAKVLRHETLTGRIYQHLGEAAFAVYESWYLPPGGRGTATLPEVAIG